MLLPSAASGGSLALLAAWTGAKDPGKEECGCRGAVGCSVAGWGTPGHRALLGSDESTLS